MISECQDWRPTADLRVLRLRAQLLAETRAFFAAGKVLEVETPALSSAATTDPQLDSFVTRFTGPGANSGRMLYLQTSPEFAMKRLLAAGSGSIYQVARVFRDGEVGARHNPEFVLLEWYRVGYDYHQLMAEVDQLVTTLLRDHIVLAPSERLSYRQAFQQYLQLDPHTVTVAELRDCVEQQGLSVAAMPGGDLDMWRDLLLSHCIEPRLGKGRLTFIYDYPASQAALARIRMGAPPVAERFELYCSGIELANGFQELTDHVEQRKRFLQDNRQRATRGKLEVTLDERFLAALAAGLPDCAGVALGFERLVMIAADVPELQQASAFCFDRA